MVRPLKFAALLTSLGLPLHGAASSSNASVTEQQVAVTSYAVTSYAVAGTVVDGEGNPLGDSEIALINRDAPTRSVRADDHGRFHMDSLPQDTATFRIRHVGFHAKNVGVRIVGDRKASMFVALERSTATMPTVNVDDEAPEHGSDQLKEFYARAQSNHFGHFLDEARMEELHPEHTSDALRAVPGVVVRPGRRIGNTVRIRGCAPLIWVDGLRAANAELDEVTRGSNVAAIEVYSSQAGVPAQYTDRSATCGTILVWLKVR